MKGIIFTYIDAIESRLGEKLDYGHPLLPWLVEHAANVRNRHAVGKDGRTPIERARGKRISRPLCEFGEKVLCMPVGARKTRRRLDRFVEGIYVGCLYLDGRSIVATDKGAVVCRTIRTMAEGSRCVEAQKVVSTPGHKESSRGARFEEGGRSRRMPEEKRRS